MIGSTRTRFFLPRFPKTGHRLVGTWKSDAKHTLEEWSWKKGTPLRKRKLIKSIFGKLWITYTQNRVIWNLPRQKWSSSRRYAVLGTDDTSVAIVVFGELEIKDRKRYDRYSLEMVKELSGKPTINHIHFTDRHYWVSLGKNREFFRRMQKDSKDSISA